MSNELIEVQRQYQPLLEPMYETFGQVLRPVGMDPDRLVNSCMIAIMKTPKLRECPAHTIANAVMTGAVLGLEMDGVTGQGYIIPRKNRGQWEAQFQPGYRGGVTTAARAGFSVNMGVVREGDAFDYRLGSEAFVHHRPKLGDESRRRIVAAWAAASAPGRASFVEILSIDQLLETKARAASAGSGFSPWNDEKIGFPAMCAKTASLRLRLPHVPILPVNQYGLASAVDITTEERGLGCHVTADGALITENGPADMHDVQPPPAGDPTRPANMAELVIYHPSGRSKTAETVDEYLKAMTEIIEGTKTPNALKAFRSANGAFIAAELRTRATDEQIADLEDLFDRRLNELESR